MFKWGLNVIVKYMLDTPCNGQSQGHVMSDNQCSEQVPKRLLS